MLSGLNSCMLVTFGNETFHPKMHGWLSVVLPIGQYGELYYVIRL
jgi:hypothetical protein